MTPDLERPVPDFSNVPVLITGGLGFIGSNLARRLVTLGAKVTIVDSLIPDYGGNLFNIRGIDTAVQVNISDVRDRYSLNSLVKDKAFIFNLAGQTSHLDSMHDPITDMEINVHAQLHILEAVRRENPDARIVFASTRQMYGKPQYLPIDEKHPLTPTDINGIHKLAGEKYHLLYHDVYGLWTTALRLTNTYGPRMRVKDTRQTFLGIWLRLAIEGKPFEVWGGEQLRDFSYVDDTVDALLQAATSEDANGKAFNIGGDKVYSLLEVAKMLTSLKGGADFLVKEFPEERKKIDIGDYYADDSLFRKLAGWQPRVDLPAGLSASLDYYAEHLSEYI